MISEKKNVLSHEWKSEGVLDDENWCEDELIWLGRSNESRHGDAMSQEVDSSAGEMSDL